VRTSRALYASVAAIGIAVLVAACAVGPGAGQGADPAIRIGNRDFGGVVAGASGPEPGVWVIAETTDLPTRFTKIVVTDERGRYVMPELPKANYSVWVRGYGLIDSPTVRTGPGRIVNLQAVPAPNATAAAQYYPPIYWYSMLKIPAASEFPGTGPKGNGIPPAQKSQGMWLNTVKTNGCMSCHALGTLGTRIIPKELGQFKSSADAWSRRIASGQAMTQMINATNRLGPQSGLDLFADWTDRIAAGELPFDRPSRPQGIERNVVLTLWDWSTPTGYMHDLISTDRRKPTVNANGKLYGAPEESTDFFPVLDPVTHTATRIRHPVRDPKTPSSKANPTQTAITEIYEPPFPGYGPRGGDIDRDGVFWASLSSGHLGKFDRKKCKILNGPAATGKHCPEGWTLYPLPGPQFRDVKDSGSAEASYYTWVDQYNTFGLGENVPIVTGNMSDSYFALVNGKFVTLRVPYPMGFFAKWSEGRIDNPAAGWKGKGLWATSASRTVYHVEGGKENRQKVIRFQLRPDPLAR